MIMNHNFCSYNINNIKCLSTRIPFVKNNLVLFTLDFISNTANNYLGQYTMLFFFKFLNADCVQSAYSYNKTTVHNTNYIRAKYNNIV